MARRLAARGARVHALLRPGYRAWRLEGTEHDIERRQVDLLDRAALDALFRELRPEAVLHLAAYGAYESQADVVRCVRTNLEATVQLMDAAASAGVARFVNAGSSSEYGLKDHPPDEDEATTPNSLYAVTKAAATAYGRHLAARGALPVTTLRLYSVYGAYEEPTRLIPTVIVRGVRGHYPPLVSPDIARDYVHVDDVVAAFEAALAPDAPSGVFNVGTGRQTTLRQVVETARAVFHIQEEPIWGTMAARKWDTTTWIANIARIARDLHWTPKIAFEDGFRKFASWLAGAPERLARYETERTPLA